MIKTSAEMDFKRRFVETAGESNVNTANAVS